ncbi:hypothetical protein [Methylocystis sp. SB2]|uniref:hypothetical protein n=1 Tax=Methylocystis sp. (strain SB2) TaxID=743836 RepID=UPI0004A45039|nr:hypothetical protein [Methylocystis sp. SB2]ULO25166.1 hypothetical protein LNB28_07210 [Methylocystis sp. SB2]
MPLQPFAQKNVDDFFSLVGQLKGGLTEEIFSFVAIRAEDGICLVQARLLLLANDSNAPLSLFTSENVRAGRYRLSDLGCDCHQFVEQLLSGKLSTPDGVLSFPGNNADQYGATYTAFHPDGLLTQSRISVLKILGKGMVQFQQPDLDWEIKASDTPYDGLQDLMQAYDLGPLSGPTNNVEVAAFNVLYVDAEKSLVDGEKAHIHVRAGKGVNTDSVKIGYRVNSKGKIITRASIPRGDINWSKDSSGLYGEAGIDVPPAAVVNAVVGYCGIAQNHFWFGDPNAFQNPRRAVYEAFDPGLASLNELLSNVKGKGDARQFESVIAWLLWMLGFGVNHLNTPNMSEAVDLIAVTPSGNYGVVECTTGLLNANNKLSKLHDRAEAVRRGLTVSNYSLLKVLPVMVTSKLKDDVKPDLEQAQRLGIFIVTRDDFDSFISRTLILPNPDQLYEEAMRIVASHESETEN